MRVSFATNRLQRQFSSESELKRAYGRDRARKLMNRLAVLDAAPSLADVSTTPPERRHPMKGDRSGQFVVDLVHPFRLVFKPDHDPLPRHPDGSIDLKAVTAIVVIEVVDYHD